MSSAQIRQRVIIRWSSRQWGLVTRPQLIEAGFRESAIDRHLVSGKLIRLLPGIYRLPGAQPCWQQKLQMALIWAGDGSVASHRTAGALLNLEGISAGFVEITSTSRIGSIRGVCVHFTRSLEDVDRVLAGGFPITSPGRTLIDLAAILEADAAETALDDALRRGLIDIPRLKRRLDQMPRGRKGSALIREFVAERDPAGATSESILETRFLRVIRRAGLPLPVAQYEISDGQTFRGRVDFAYPAEKVAIEADGFRFHFARQKFNGDRVRRNQLSGMGWIVIHVTWDDLKNGGREVLEALIGALGRDQLVLPGT